MWFNNAIIYQYHLEDQIDLNEALSDETIKPCPPHARFIYGWIPAYADELVQEVAGSALICLGKEERVLPRSVVNRMLDEKIQNIEQQQDRNVKRAERAQLAEDLEFELLPKSFCIQKKIPAILDTISNRLIVNASSNNQASQLTSFLRKTLPGIKIEPFHNAENLATRFAEWIADPAKLPANFELASDCLLFSLDDEKKRVNCKGYELPAEEIQTLLSQGLAAAEISLIWNERIQFTLTHDLVFKRLKSLDYLVDEFNEIENMEEVYQQQDAALTLLTGEFRSLFHDVIQAIGSEEKASKEPQVETTF